MGVQLVAAALEAAAFPCACTALGALAVVALRRPAGERASRVLLGFSAGVMLAACLFSLLLPAIERAGPAGWWQAGAGLLAGVALLMGTEAAAGQLLRGERGRAGRVTLAITLHNLPEGMVVGLAAALGTAGDPEALAGAAALSLGIGLQNIPEGAAVSLPVRQAGASRVKAFGAGAASGLVEPAGAVLAALLAAPVAGALPWLLSMSAGAMLCGTLEELVPAACGRGRAGMAALAVGFAVMMALDVALG